MLIEVAQEVSAVIPVGNAVLVGVWIVERNAHNVLIVFQGTDAVRISQVDHGEQHALLQSVLPDEPVGFRVVVGIVGHLLIHRSVQLEHIQLERGQGVTEAVAFVEGKPQVA